MSKARTILVSLLTVGAALAAFATSVDAQTKAQPTAATQRSTIYEAGARGQFVSTNFTGSFTPGTGETVVSQTWKFGDGAQASSPNVEKSYTNAGLYTAEFIVVVDTGNNNFETRVKSVPVTVLNPAPTTSHVPPAIASGQALAVTFDIFDNQNVSQATLFYRHTGETSFQSQAMTKQQVALAKGMTRWSYSIPSTYLTAPVEYYVKVTDVSTSPQTVDLRPSATTYYTSSGGANDNVPPTVTIELAGTKVVAYGTSLTANAQLSDTSGVQSATFFWRKGATGAYTSAPINVSLGLVSIPWNASMAGLYNWYVTATDARGNLGEKNSQGNPGSVSIAIGPKVTHTPPAGLQKLAEGGILNVAATTVDDKAGAVVNLSYSFGGAWTKVAMTPGADGASRQFTGSIPIPAGEFASKDVWYYVNATDADKNKVATGPYRITFAADDDKPTITGESPTGAVKSVTEVKATLADTGSGLDPATLVVKIDGITVTPALTGGELKVTGATVTGLSEASHKVTVTVKDVFGNEATKEWSFTVDKTAPTVTLAGLEASMTSLKPTATITFSDGTGSGIDAATLAVKLDGATVTTTTTASGATFTPSADLAKGSHTLTVSVKDKAGNEGTASKTFDLAGPAVSGEDGKGLFGLPGFEALLALAALGAAVLVLRKR